LSDEELLKILDDHDWASVPTPTRRRLLPGIKRAMRSASILTLLGAIETINAVEKNKPVDKNGTDDIHY